ncbi:MAG: hypothetical protein ABJ327_12005 [Litoreibacter sp.]
MTAYIQPLVSSLWQTPFLYAAITNFIWINLSEVFRYFAFIMPMMREALPMVPDIAPMNAPTFMIWGIWDAIVVGAATLIPWLMLNVAGGTIKNALLAGTGVWLTIFGVFWLGTFNMNLATPAIVLTALSLAWFEMMVAALIVWWFCFRSALEQK